MQWYAEAMRLWKRGPVVFSLLALVILATNLLLSVLPIAGTLAAQLVLPLLECALLYASLAADRGDRPRMRHLVAVVAAPPRAQAAIVLAGLLVFAAEAIVAEAVGGVNLLAPAGNAESISGLSLVSAYTAGIALSLPLMFVPFAALFDGVGFRAVGRAKHRCVSQQRGLSCRVRRTDARTAAFRSRDERRRTAACTALVGRGFLRVLEGRLRRRLKRRL
jgi:hypothetical protein